MNEGGQEGEHPVKSVIEHKCDTSVVPGLYKRMYDPVFFPVTCIMVQLDQSKEA